MIDEKKYATVFNITEEEPVCDQHSICLRWLSYPKSKKLRLIEGGMRAGGNFKRSFSDKPLITIITVVRNGENTLERCIKSVLGQNYDNIEYIIIDGNSTDGTLGIIESYKDYVDYYLSEEDSGIYDAMNKGISLASGDFIYMLNSDDYLSDYGIEEIFSDKLAVNSKIIVTSVRMVDEKENLIVMPKNVNESVYLSVPPLHPGTIYHKDVYNYVGCYSAEYKIVSDWEFFLRVFKSDKYKIKNSYVLVNNFSTFGISSGNSEENIKKHLEERSLVIRSYFDGVNEEVADFLAGAYWKSKDEIVSYLKENRGKCFSVELLSALSCLLNEKDKSFFFDDINKIFLSSEKYIMKGREDMTSNLRNISKIPTPYNEGKKHVNIVLSSDENYEPHLWVTIASLFDNAKSDSDYYVYILDGGIASKDNFLSLAKRSKNFHIEFVDMKKQFIFAFESRHIKKAAYYRLAIFHLFEDFDRIIYIDADSFVLSDVYELFNINMEDKKIAGCQDSLVFQKSLRDSIINDFHYFNGTRLDYYVKFLGFSDKRIEKYFSSGVLVFNLKIIDIPYKKREVEKLLLKDFYCHDQDILNLIFDENEVFILSRNWNYFNVTNFLNSSDIMNDNEVDFYCNISINPKIISYVLKPWLLAYAEGDFADLYWNKLKESSYYEKVLKNFLEERDVMLDNKVQIVGENNFYDKIKFAFYSPKKFILKYFRKFFNLNFRQLARKAWCWLQKKELK